jgi:ABC-type branched-subunit amino acid transport system substrate-binding protein
MNRADAGGGSAGTTPGLLDRRGRVLAIGLATFLGLAAVAVPSTHAGRPSGVRAAAGPGGATGATTASTAAATGDAAGGPAPAGGAAAAPSTRTASAAGRTAATTAVGTGLHPRQVKTGFGVTATTIRIGIFTADFAGLQNVKGFNTGNPEIQARAVADAVNASGGIAGRKVELFFAGGSATSRNWDADEQAVCSYFAEDAKVFAAIYTIVSEGRTLQPCLARRGIPFLAAAGGPHDQRVMDQNPTTLFYTSSLNMTRASAAYVDGLAAGGFFTASDKIGLVRPNDDTYARATAEGIKPRLAANHLKLEDEAAIDAQTSLSDTASAMPPIVLRFQQHGINKVLFLDNGTVGALFVTQAGSQAYYPKYGFSSLSNPNFFVANTPPQTLTGSMGVGWIPALDVDAQHEPKMGAATARCTAIMAKAGESGVDRSGVLVQRNLCDGLFFVKLALDEASELTATGMAARADRLATSFDAASTFASRFGPGVHDGAAQTRLFAYDAACRCYQYSGAVRAVP